MARLGGGKCIQVLRIDDITGWGMDTDLGYLAASGIEG